MAKHRQEYLRYLLEKDRLTSEESEWMYTYLDQNELSELETIAAEEYNMDVASFKNVRDIRLTEEVLNKIHQRIEIPQPSFGQILRMRRIRYVVAVCVLLIIGWGYLFFDIVKGSFNARDVQQVITAANERKTVRLPDGSLVSLEPGTSLTYSRKFSGETREVNLKGEAFFEITKDAAHPFIIHTKYINTTVLGTSFNVEAYESREPKVIVVTGVVKVQTKKEGKQEQVLSANQSVVYSSNTGALQKSETPVDARFYQQRKTGKFIYRGEAMQKVVEDMERHYNTAITIEGNVDACLFYGDLFAHDSLNKALNLIAASLNATVKKDNSKGYLIVGGGCK